MEQNDKRKKVILDLMGEEFYIPMKEKELAVMLQVTKEDRSELNRILNELLTEGKISITKKGKFIKAKHAPEALIGTFISHPKGFGFVEVEGREDDLYIPENCINGAFHKAIAGTAWKTSGSSDYGNCSQRHETGRRHI